ncbi:MAG: response regulator [Caldilineaceae bacterium]|nr:response regulator [Caldilineaceae bacterium]
MRRATVIGLAVLAPAAGLLFSRPTILRLVAWAALPLCILSLLAASGQFPAQGALQPRLDDLWLILFGLSASSALALSTGHDTHAGARQAQRTAAALATTSQELEASQALLHQVRGQLDQQAVERTVEFAQVNRQLVAECAARRQSERHWRRLAECSPDLICIWDIPSRRWTYCSRPDFLGHPSRANLNYPDLLQHVHPDDYHRVKARWPNFAASPQGEHLEYRLHHADGHWEWLQARQRVLARDDHGRPVQNLIALSVITDQKQGEAALRLAKENAEAAARAGYEFLANMSHEIRTPMNGVVGMASLLQSTELSEGQRLYVDAIRHSSDALLAVVDDILGFSKTAPGGLSLERQPMEPHRCVEEVLDLLAPRAAEKDLELVYTVERSVPAAVLGDAARLRQVLSNVVSTVLEWTAQGTVSISLDAQSLDDREVELHFAVGNTGIAPADRPPQPGSLHPVDAAHTPIQGDAAGALARSANLCLLMGGRLWADSHPQAGATLHFTVVSPAIAPTGAQDIFEAHPALDRRTALVVDDNPPARQILRQMLNHWGITVTPVASGAEALALMRTQARFDIAVIDMQMPGMSGLALVRELRKLAADLPVIMTSALGAPMYAAGNPRGLQELPVMLPAALAANERHEAARQLGVRDILLKPVKPSKLRTALLGHFNTTSAAGDPDQPLVSGAPQGAGSDDRQPLRILLAEDNLTNQKVALHMLKRLGYGADVAVNGLEAVGAAHRRRYDVILMDIQMPEMDGLKATHQIRTELAAPDQPYIIAMTAAAMQYDAERCLAAGMDDFVAKPARLEDLAQALQRYLAQTTGADDRAVDTAQRSQTRPQTILG